MKSPCIRLLVTDLDNTLYDWVTFFTSAFYEMARVAAEILSVEEDDLLTDLQEVHKRHHNSEQPFALLETRTVERKLPGMSYDARAEHLDRAFHAFNKVRHQQLQLYSGVADTLRTLSGQDVPIVAHTEATVTNAWFRLNKLGIAQFIDRLYAVTPTGKARPMPARMRTPEPPPEKVKYLQEGERKPDVRVLLDICNDMNIEPQHVLYVGDSISRDIGMAKSAGAWAAWAQYGTCYDPSLWPRLVRISHWNEEDVARAQYAQDLYRHVKPDVILESGLSEVTRHFHFHSRQAHAACRD